MRQAETRPAGASVPITLRPLTKDDIPAAQALTESFQWPHQSGDWTLMQSLGEGIVAERQGRLVGTALCWRYGTDWASVGMIGVVASLQGQGIGRRMMLTLMQDLAGRGIALHATRAGMPLYGSLGFVATGTTVQHEGATLHPELVALPGSLRLRPAVRTDLFPLSALDRAACGMDRTDLLAALLKIPGGIVLDRADGPVGFACVRRFGRGQVIGPVIAPALPIARALIAHLLGTRTGQFMRIDVPRESGLCPWLRALGLDEAGTVIRMVRGADVPPSPRARVFALASQAFG